MLQRYKYFTILILTLVFSSYAYTGQGQQNLLKLDKVTNDVLSNNKEIKLAALQLERAKLELEKEKAIALTNPSAEGLVSKELAAKTKQLELENLKIRLLEEAETLYYNIWTAQENTEIYAESLGQVKENLRIITLRSKAGLSTGLEVLEAKNMVDDALMKYQNEADSETNFKKKLAILMGRSNLDGVVVDDSLESEVVKITDSQIAEGKIRDSEYNSALNNVELAKLKAKLADTPYSPIIDKQISLKELQESELKLQVVKEKVLATMQELKVQILSDERQTRVAVKLKKYQNEKYISVKARYQKGLELANKLIEAQIDLTNSKLNYTKSLIETNLAKRKLLNMVLHN